MVKTKNTKANQEWLKRAKQPFTIDGEYLILDEPEYLLRMQIIGIAKAQWLDIHQGTKQKVHEYYDFLKPHFAGKILNYQFVKL